VAEDTAREDKTEPASERRLRQAREEGNVALGRDAVGVAALAAGAATLIAVGPTLRDALVMLVAASARTLATGQPRELVPLLWRPAALLIAACAAAATAAAVAAVVQTRGGLWGNLALPDFSRVFGGERMGRMFKRETLVDLGVALVKIVTVGGTLWWAFKVDIGRLPRLITTGADGQMAALFGSLRDGLVKVLASLVLLAGLDLALTRFRFRERMKMTKEEAKREYREDEGDPLLRSRRRRQHRELAKGRVAVEVPRADALLVNPTHIAIALRYRPGEDKAPKVTAKGKGEAAEAMRALAREHGIPIVEDIPLARLLFKRVKVGRTVPVETYRAVAGILAFVYRVLGRSRAVGAATGAQAGLR
jgi:flagellar biosynthesis protein FlhB